MPSEPQLYFSESSVDSNRVIGKVTHEFYVRQPICQPCYDQHGKARKSRRQAARFDRGRNRRRNAENARQREGQVAEATARREAATTAATTSTTTPTVGAGNVIRNEDHHRTSHQHQS